MELRNRLVMAPMGVEIVAGDGHANEALIAYYEERARGGVGLIITEVCAMAYPRGANSVHQLGLSDDAFIPALRVLTDRVHSHGAKIAVQLVHHGKVSRLDMLQGRPLPVPSIPEWHGSLDMIDDLSVEELTLMAKASGGGAPSYFEMDADDIAETVSQFAAATERACRAGFDGVEIHAAHGYLISAFLSPQWNRRTDDYGGSHESRARLLCEVLRESKAAAGEDFPVWCRLDALEYRTPEGIRFEDTERTAVLAEAAGADAIHLSAYGDATSGPAFTEGTLPYREAPHAALTARLKKAVSVPVIGVGRISPSVGEEMIANRKADLIAMGRQLLADPALASKLETGRPDDIRPCINCYVCVARPFFDERVRCAVNPVLANEPDLADIERTLAPVPRKVAVVGGGPAGMEAARVAALRGHDVVLHEAAAQLGGSLRFAALVFEPNRRLLRWLEAQLDQLGVDVRLGCRVSAAEIAASGAEAVLVATGAARRRPDIEGIEQPHVLDGDDLRDLLIGGRSRTVSTWADRGQPAGDGDGARSAAGGVRRLGGDEERARPEPRDGRWLARTGFSVFGRLAVRAAKALRLTADPERLARLTHVYMPLGKRVVVVGGGLVGIELAEFLAHRGRSVAVITEGDKAALEMAHPRRWRVLADLREQGTQIVTGAADVRIRCREVHCDVEGAARSFPADHVVIATGLSSDSRFADELRAAGLDPVEIGDCSGIGYIEGAIRDGFHAAATL